MKTGNRFGLGLAATFGLSALLMGLAGATPAQAQSWENYGRNHIYRDIADVRRDERILRDLQFKHDEARRRKDWDRMHFYDRRIAELRRHINEDRREIREEIDRNRDRNDRYSSDRYRNDRYNDDRYRNDRYNDSRYRNDRYNR